MYTTESGLAIVWAGLVSSGAYTLEQVPALGNLPEAVKQRLEEQALVELGF